MNCLPEVRLASEMSLELIGWTMSLASEDTQSQLYWSSCCSAGGREAAKKWHCRGSHFGTSAWRTGTRLPSEAAVPNRVVRLGVKGVWGFF